MKNLLRKLLVIPLLTLMFVTSVYGAPVFSVGHTMPTDIIMKDFILGESGRWSGENKSGMGFLYYDKGVGQPVFLIVYLFCDGEPTLNPFGIFDVTTKTLYLDKDNDGLIDEIKIKPKGGIAEEAGNCDGCS